MWYKIKKIYQWTNLVRPVWKPWSNTVMYYPFKDDQLDKVWTSSLPLTWIKQTLWYNFSGSWEYKVNNPNVNNRFISVWVKFNSLITSSWASQTIFTYPAEVNYCLYNAATSFTKRFWCYVSTSGSTTDKWKSFGNYDYVLWQWVHLAYGTDWTKCVAYVNWVLNWTYTTNSTLSRWMTFLRWMDLTYSELIGESVCWTSQEVQNYYNSTKSKYWL